MTYEEYCEIALKADQALTGQDFDGAIGFLKSLVDSDLADLDRSVMCVNIATVWEKKGNALEALRWLDKAAQIERPHKRFFALEQKAAALFRHGRKEEAADIYRDLLGQPYLAMSDRQRVQANLKLLEGS